MHRWTGSSLVQVMVCCLFGVKPLPEPMVVIDNRTPGSKFHWNVKQNSNFFIQENKFVMLFAKLSAIFSRGRWVGLNNKVIVSTDGKPIHLLNKIHQTVDIHRRLNWLSYFSARSPIVAQDSLITNHLNSAMEFLYRHYSICYWSNVSLI